jgi:hypothetical protein
MSDMDDRDVPASPRLPRLRREVRLSGPRRPAPIFDWFGRWLAEPQPVERLAIIRILTPLAILGFMAGRAANADEWLGDGGFRVPDHAGDWRQPLYLPGLSSSLSWGLAALLVASGISLSIGYRARLAALLFASALIYVALADRLAAFTVSKIAPAIALALAVSPCGVRYSIDAVRRARARPGAPRPTMVTGGSVRFFQTFLAVFYASSGICKARGDWLTNRLVLWTHVHDSYQTSVSFFLARVTPSFVWTVLQITVLGFELFAPIWFSIKATRLPALIVGLSMHTMIGLMFGPVRWFALLMIALLLGAYLPDTALERVSAWIAARLRPVRRAARARS